MGKGAGSQLLELFGLQGMAGQGQHMGRIGTVAQGEGNLAQLVRLGIAIYRDMGDIGKADAGFLQAIADGFGGKAGPVLDAAEAFLAVSTKYETTARAPDALLRLGQSLAALGEKEAACASLGEVLRKYPKASASVKQNVDREQKRVHC